MKDFFRKSMLFGIGLASVTREKTEEIVEEMVKRGEMSRKEGEETVEEILEKSKEVRNETIKKVEEMVRDYLGKFDVATKTDLTALDERIRSLESEVANLQAHLAKLEKPKKSTY